MTAKPEGLDAQKGLCAPSYRPLKGKTILFGISGGIAAYKAGDFARGFIRLGAKVRPVMTANAAKFVSPLTISALTGEKVHLDMFDMATAETIPHISLARSADVFIVLPAAADMLAKAACGLADDLLSILLLSFRGAVVFFPSMNPAMYENRMTMRNMEILRAAGHVIAQPDAGMTACGEEGRGRLPEWPAVREIVLRAVTAQSLKGRTVIVTAGPTREPLDPVRFISNRSSGLMGFHMARIAYRRGADVVLIHGPVSAPPPPGVKTMSVETAKQMLDAVEGLSADADIIVMAAAVSDYAPLVKTEQKIKKCDEKISIDMTRTTDILARLVDRKKASQIIVGFCAETQNLEQEAVKKMANKRPDLLIANDVSRPDSGFDVNTNKVLILSRDLSAESLPLLDKEAVSEEIWDRIERL
ncbi:MAG: bifunctional phosphopantothenoylcysteine decarboxylase/phosphopantothenate--cysteine ligase CoaBC [Desulfobacteraceae bacterium]|nr:bifunctional phosphopantothenoylcysteine decarboxylase/phosphopantothenate--cysteine ligase CoaBC [Desulfobacteraceae bacterium]